MLDRVGNSQHRQYNNYGGRGITVCDRWRRFEAFAEDMGATFKPELELDRIDVNGNYRPSNCRWITHAEQQRNKRTNHIVSFAGRTQTVQDWAELLAIKPNTLIYRLRRGWSTERALRTGADSDVWQRLLSVNSAQVQEGTR
ncbi:hypothetical protein [Lentzea cavernae]|uniref:HNH endonuclease n=1 Tax=Lentzea cavernae TaxID=2020703 RepID=A0ABQ3MTU7_9PSEU|nr:hypothetical protein [Lentzea cavernae]GHH57586.1 hypothetical protein GCM10017774_77350 [Lentzea cavernae]